MHSALGIRAEGAVETVRSDSGSAAQPGKVPIIEVAFKNGMWWSIPWEMSQALYEKHLQGENAGYVWDWGEHRDGSWVNDDEATSINRYVIDYIAKRQENIDTGSIRSIRVAWVSPADVEPRWTGQKIS